MHFYSRGYLLIMLLPILPCPSYNHKKHVAVSWIITGFPEGRHVEHIWAGSENAELRPKQRVEAAASCTPPKVCLPEFVAVWTPDMSFMIRYVLCCVSSPLNALQQLRKQLHCLATSHIPSRPWLELGGPEGEGVGKKVGWKDRGGWAWGNGSALNSSIMTYNKCSPRNKEAELPQ